MLVPISYNLRSLFVRRSATLLTVLGIAATVAILAGVLALQQGFRSLFSQAGRDDLAVMLRPGATNEGDSIFSYDRGLKVMKSVSGIQSDEQGLPLASMECYVAVLLDRLGGRGKDQTNVPIRGVQPRTFDLRGDEVRISEGRAFSPGSDELIVGRDLVERISNCQVGDVLTLNTSPFRIVGVFENEGPFASEIWGDLDRLLEALGRYGPNRILAQLDPELYGPAADPSEVEYTEKLGAFAATMKAHPEVPAKVMTEAEYLLSQTSGLTIVLTFLGGFLGLIMGMAAVFTATNTMLTAVSARTGEIGILLSTGFRPVPIFLSFLFESLLLGLLGGLLGVLLVLPLNGVETGTTNFQTFTEVAFAFRTTPRVLATAVIFAVLLGLIGGALPAWRAARMTPTEALRRR